MSEPYDSPIPEDLDREKAVLRLKARAARRSVTPELRTAAAYSIAERALELPEILSATSAAMYGATKEEADPSVLEFALRERGLRIAYPRVAGPYLLMMHWVDSPDVLTAGRSGIAEPVESAPFVNFTKLSVVMVPGVAFDEDCNRLGFGGGYYDGLFADQTNRPTTIGIAYDEQIVDHVPHEERDRPVDIVITPTRVFRSATTSL